MKKRGLGRGLDALLGNHSSEDGSVVVQTKTSVEGLQMLNVDKIQRGRYQPRRDMNEQALEELADSIRSQGVIQPIVVRSIDMGRYEIIAGERRWRAAQLAGMTEIPVSIRDVPDEAAIAMALIENIQREDLNPIEEAMALQRLIDEFELTQQRVAEIVGKSRTTVTNLLRLIKLAPETKRMLEYGDIEMGHARALLSLAAEEQVKVAKEVVSRGLTVRQTEELVKRLQHPEPIKERVEATPELEMLEKRWKETLGMKVKISQTDNGTGKLTISYDSANQLSAILDRIG